MNWFTEPMPDEVSYDEILKKAENGEFHKWNFQPVEEFQANGYEDVIDEIKKYTAVDYLKLRELKEKAEKEGDKASAQEYADKMEAMTQAVMKIYREKNIFPIQYFSELGILDEIAKCIAYKAEFDGNTVSCVTGDTEYFNGKEWRRIDQYVEGDKVLQYNPDGTATLVEPLRYIHYQSDDPFYQYNNSGRRSSKQKNGYAVISNPKLTGNHNVAYYTDRSLLKLMLKSLEDLFKTDEEDVGVPVSGEYDGGEDENIEIISQTFAAVILQEKDAMTSYNTINNDEIGLSDKCFRLSLKSRLALLKLFGLEDLDPDDDVENEWSLGNSLPTDVMKQIVCLCSLTFRKTNLYRGYVDGTWLVRSWYFSLAEENYNKIYEKDKYCFSVPSHMLILRVDGVTFITGNCGAGIGTSLCNYLFPNLYDTPSAHDLDKENARSLFEKFHNDKYLRRAIEFCFGYKNGCPVPTSVTGGLRLVGSAPTNFRPMNAKAIYERFCPKGGTIYDFCCVDGKTEFFDGKRWKSIADYKEGDEVLQFCDNGTAEMVKPLEYIHYKSDEPFYLYENGYDLSTCLTGNHDVVILVDEDHCKYQKIKMEDIVKGTCREDIPLYVPLVFRYGGDVEVDPDFMLLMLILYSLACYNSFAPGTVVYHDGEFIIDFDKAGFYWKACSCEDEYLGKFFLTMYRATESGVSFSYTSDKILKIHCEDFKTYFFEKDNSPRFNGDAWNKISSDSKDEFWDVKDEFCPDYTDYILTCAFPEDYDAKQFFINSIGKASMYETDYIDRMFRSDYVGVSEYYIGEGSSEVYKEVYEEDKYCFTVPSHMLVLRRKKKIFITGNCGFGGRLLGALSSKNNYRYVGTDPCTETMYHLHQLGEYIEQVTGREDSYELHCCGSEEFKGPKNSIDFAFSSPPYFNLEVYSDEPTQCFNKFPELDEWLEGYVRATIKNIKHMLKPGKLYAVNIADFKVGSGNTVAYVDEWIRISKEEGMPLFDTVYLGVTARAGSAEQAAGELKKENILIFKKPLW